tara:strand:+ start:34001 stop:35665 length:1665 start_codon:yes stop_codon:yes gene_type:complete
MVIDPTKLLPPGKEGTPEGRVDNPGVPEGNLTVKQYNSLNKNIFAIQRNLGAIADLIGGRNAQDAQEDKREIKQKRESADSLKKGTKENFIESAIKNGLVKPIQALKKKAMGPFGGFMKALEALFLGWLGIKGLDALEAWSEGDNDAFEKIKNDIIKGLAIAGGIALALNGGIGAITGVISGVLTSMLLNIPKILGLLANPYLLIGAIAVAAGVSLFNIIKNDSLSGGRASYEGYTQGVIDKMATGGKDEAKEYLYKEKADLLKRQPWLRNANPVRRNASKAGALLNEIEQNIASIDAGEFDWALKESLTEKDLKLINDITAAIKKLSGDNEKYLPLREEMDIALARVDDDVTKLSASDKKKYDKMMSLEGGLRTSMKYVRSLRDKMSNDGKKWFSARVDLFNPAMFNSSTADIPLFEEQTGLRLRLGESDPSRLKNLDELVESLNNGVGKVSAPESTVAPPEKQDPPETNITPQQVTPLKNTPYKLEPVGNTSYLPNVEGQIASLPNVIVMPVDDRGSEAEPSASTPTATAYPSIVTADPLNDHLSFTKITYS